MNTDDLGEASQAERWLERVAGEDAEAEAFVAKALGVIDRVLATHHDPDLDPDGPEISLAAAVPKRIGYGSGDQVAESAWTEARTLGSPPG